MYPFLPLKIFDNFLWPKYKILALKFSIIGLLATPSPIFSATKLFNHWTILCFLGHDVASLLCLYSKFWIPMLFTACVLKSYLFFTVKFRFHLGEGWPTPTLVGCSFSMFLVLFRQHMYFLGANYFFPFYYLNSEHSAVYLVVFNWLNDYLVKIHVFSDYEDIFDRH